MATSLGEHLINEILPKAYHGRGPLTKSALNGILVEIGKNHPEQYPDIVTKLKRLGDEVSTLEGISVGLDDVAPDYAKRDAVLKPFMEKFHKTKNEKTLLDAQNAMLEYTKKNTGTMGEMMRSGGRGNAPQLMKIVGAPVLARDEHDKIVPWMISRSYSEGLKPSDSWVAGNEARINAIKSNISVVEPGDLAKILINNMGDKLITMTDCGVDNGVSMNPNDSHIIDRYLARKAGPVPAGTLITPQIAQRLPRDTAVVVRSPMTCKTPHGICQKCQGLSPSGALHGLGTNVGMRAAQAMAEPLTQFALNAKHGGRIDTGIGSDKKLEGIKGVRQALEIPQSFLHKATLAEHDGEVSHVEDAPQGGKYVWLDKTRHYVGPDLTVTVKPKQKMEAGDMLSNGVPKPDEIVHHKGLGAGRQYLVDTLHDIYKRAGVDIDKRHVETLARSVLNHVYVADTSADSDHGFVKGDIINYNRYNAAIADSQRTLPLHDSLGETLGGDVLHFTAGTRVTPSVHDMLAKHGIKDVHVLTSGPRVEPMMRPASRTPLLNTDWMARLAHRYLKESLVAGAHRGDISDLHGPHAAPAYAAGTEFGQGPGGTY